jgi:ABC-2 type transport system ATP-binding protein
LKTVSFEGIRKSYGEVEALKTVSFDVGEGEVFGLLGPNGAGKTTLIRILMDIIRPDAGTITLFGQKHTADALDDVTYLPEERGLYVKHRVLDVMIYFGMLKGLARREARDRSNQWLERMGLAESARWRVSRLSKGMSQKVQVASTLLPKPKLCVLDEPFSGLDPVNVRLVQELLDERRQAGLTTILSTHQMNLVDTLCDRVALIDRGRLMVYGPVDEVRRRYSLPEVRVTLTTPLPAIRGVERADEEQGGTWRLLLGDGAEPSRILGELVASGAGVERFEKVLTPMEEVFIRVVDQGRSATP